MARDVSLLEASFLPDRGTCNLLGVSPADEGDGVIICSSFLETMRGLSLARHVLLVTMRGLSLARHVHVVSAYAAGHSFLLVEGPE